MECCVISRRYKIFHCDKVLTTWHHFYQQKSSIPKLLSQCLGPTKHWGRVVGSEIFCPKLLGFTNKEESHHSSTHHKDTARGGAGTEMKAGGIEMNVEWNHAVENKMKQETNGTECQRTTYMIHWSEQNHTEYRTESGGRMSSANELAQNKNSEGHVVRGSNSWKGKNIKGQLKTWKYTENTLHVHTNQIYPTGWYIIGWVSRSKIL